MAATALVIPVPEAYVATQPWRGLYLGDASAGMPPHVTLLSPFVDEAALVSGQIRELRRVFSGFSPFEFSLTRLAEFPAPAGDGPVLYLTPEPDEPFQLLTAAIVRAFPEYPPYGSRFDGVTPHLTIATVPEAPLQEIREAVLPALPITARALEAHLMCWGAEAWRIRSVIQLGRREPDYRDDPLFV